MKETSVKKEFGFSLIELMVVISIMAILSIISIGSLSAIQKNNRDSKRQADLRLIQGALQQFYADANYYPYALNLTTANLQINSCSGDPACTTVVKTYMTQVPTDPTSGTTTPYCYAAFKTSSATVACDVAVKKDCHYYKLVANLENPAGTNTYSCGSAPANSYDFQVTPL